ncbi:DUF2911 domain-containing protein [Flavobacteriaceae bacterium F08102]|nr:DUF2911 domain-containing protein [Flavobacteriaceae bacterium F08102]
MNRINVIRFIICLCIAVLLKQSIHAQNKTKLEETPLDISYYRGDSLDEPIVKVIYGRVKKNTSTVFGEQIPFNKVWSTGAKVATEVKFYKDVNFGGVHISAGTYILYTVPHKHTWDVILSANLNGIGPDCYNPLFDRARVSVNVDQAASIEYFTIGFEESSTGFDMILRWDTTKINIPLKLENADNFILAKI